MPHKDREVYLRYMREYHARTRPRPAPLPQERGDLPPIGVLAVEDDGSRVQCHACGRWLVRLTGHRRIHGFASDDAYRERYGLARSISLASPVWAAKQRAANLTRGQNLLLVQARGTVNPDRRGVKNRLSSRISYSKAKTGRYRGRAR